VRFLDGRFAAVGPRTEVFGRTDVMAPYDSGEAGAVIDAVICGHDPSFGLTQVRSPAGTLQAPHLDLPVGTPVRLRIRAREVMIATTPPEGLSALNVLPALVTALDAAGEGSVTVGLDCGGVHRAARLTRKSVDTFRLEPGRRVYAVIKSVALDRDTLGRAPGFGGPGPADPPPGGG